MMNKKKPDALIPHGLLVDKLASGERLDQLETENRLLRDLVNKLERKVLSLRNERAAMQQWFNWLKGHINAFGVFSGPDYVAEVAWENPPKSWREGGEGGKVTQASTVKKDPQDYEGSSVLIVGPDHTIRENENES